MNSLDILEDWALRYHCNSIDIHNIGNPGWSIEIDLKGTILEGLSIKWELIEGFVDGWYEGDWYGVAIVDNVFKASGGAKKLGVLLSQFKDLVEQKENEFVWDNSARNNKREQEEASMDIVAWIEDWYSFHCDRDWEQEYGCSIRTVENGGWSVQIDLIETLLEDTEIAWQLVKKSENDWYGLAIKDSVFTASGDLQKLSFLLHSFKALVEAADEDFEE